MTTASTRGPQHSSISSAQPDGERLIDAEGYLPLVRIVLVGPPGAGKGTQAQFIADHLHVPKISTGDMFRTHIKGETPLGIQVKTFLNAGKLVPDEVTIAMVRDRLAQPDAVDGFLLDGFPRNVAQARVLDGILADAGIAGSETGARLDVVLDLEVDNDEVVKRISGRRLCRNDDQHIFHVDYSPSTAGEKCDKCGGELYQRSDDQEGVVQHRLEVYADETAPIIGFYREQGILSTIDATGSVDEITKRALAVLPDQG